MSSIITKEKQIEALTVMIDIAKKECLQAIESGLSWAMVQACQDKDDPKIDRVLTIKYQLPSSGKLEYAKQ